jgi:uncharacterized membrane protein
MRYFPFKILVLCILLPPVLYLASVRWLEWAVERSYKTEIHKISAGDIKPLLDGRERLKDVLAENIDRFLSSRHAFLNDVRVTVSVYAGTDELLYPQPFDDQKNLLESSDTLKIAEDNYRLLNGGLSVEVSAALDPYSFLSYLLLAIIVTCAVLFFYIFYRAGVRKALLDGEKRSREWEEMLAREQDNKKMLEQLLQIRTELDQHLDAMKEKLSKASQSEDDMIDEIVSLEEKIEQNEALQKEQKEEIESLKQAIDQAKSVKGKKAKQGSKTNDFVSKRFKTVYKNLTFHDRSIDGYQDLEDAMKLKCEEVIHLLNDEPDQVIIKRKVFGKKNRETVFEVIFAYKGRLYFRRLKDNTIEILAVGTKNTQDRELEFLDRL